MSLPGWKKLTIEAVAEHTGPVAELLVDDALVASGLSESEMTAGTYIRFLQKLYLELPGEIDRNRACQEIRKRVLSKFGF